MEKDGVDHENANGSVGEKVRNSVDRSEDECVNEWMDDVVSKSAGGFWMNGG